MSGPRYTLADYAEEPDFAARRIVERAGPSFSMVWADLHLGSGVACLVGPTAEGPAFRFYAASSVPNAMSVDGNARIHGSTSILEPVSVPLTTPGMPRPRPPAGIAREMAFLDESMPLYGRCWCGMGATWPVAMMHRGGAEKGHWAFVQVATDYPDRMRVIVDLVVTRDMMVAHRAASRPAQSGAGRQ